MAWNSYGLDEHASAFLGVRGNTPALLGELFSDLVSSWGRWMDRLAPSLISSTDTLFTSGDLLLGNRSTGFYLLLERAIGGPRGYLGWLDLRRYALEHLFSWTVIVLIGVGVWHLWDRRKHHDAYAERLLAQGGKPQQPEL